MNQKFYALPEEKKQRIITSGYRIFRENPYRKCPVGEIAKEAGISKSLLFFYFRNKKELYLFLLDEALKTAMEKMDVDRILEEQDFFKILELGMKRKIWLLAAGGTILSPHDRPSGTGKICAGAGCFDDVSGNVLGKRRLSEDAAPEGKAGCCKSRGRIWETAGLLEERLPSKRRGRLTGERKKNGESD